MFEYIRNSVAKTVSNGLINLAGYVGGYTLIDPDDKHGIKNSRLMCKGNIICIPFYHSGHCCQVYLKFDRNNFDEEAYGVLFPDGRIVDISTGCPGLGKPSINPDVFGTGCRIICSRIMDSFPEHISEMSDEDYYYMDEEEEAVEESEVSDCTSPSSEEEQEENMTGSEYDTMKEELKKPETMLNNTESYEQRSRDVLHEEDEDMDDLLGPTPYYLFMKTEMLYLKQKYPEMDSKRHFEMARDRFLRSGQNSNTKYD
jgi:hypothetical protein